MYRGTSKVPKLSGISVTGWTGLLGRFNAVEKIASVFASAISFSKLKISRKLLLSTFCIFSFFCDPLIFIFDFCFFRKNNFFLRVRSRCATLRTLRAHTALRRSLSPVVDGRTHVRSWRKQTYEFGAAGLFLTHSGLAAKKDDAAQHS